MITLRVVLASVAMCCLLLLADIALRARSYNRDSFAKRFGVTDLYTNGTSGILIYDRIKNQPLWEKWNFAAGDSVNCYVEGKLALSVASVKVGRSLTEVFFYGEDGKLHSLWKARENGLFYGRMFFDEGGTRSEVWLNASWLPVEMRTNGGKTEAWTQVDGKWRHVILTNGTTSVED